jgi:hypothetical protein
LAEGGHRARRYVLVGAGVYLLGLFTFLFFAWHVWRALPDWKPARVTYEVKASGDVLYVKGIAYGLLGDHQEWWITANGRSEEADSLTDYVFPWSNPFFYKLADDTLVVYTRRAVGTPIHFPSGISVRQVELSNPQFMGLYDIEDSLGLETARFGKD